MIGEIDGVKIYLTPEQYKKYKKSLEEQLEEKDKEIERLHSIIKEAREYIKWHYDLATDENVEFCLLRDRVLEILEKEVK